MPGTTTGEDRTARSNSSHPARPSRGRSLPGTSQAPVRPRRLPQRIRAGRLKAQVPAADTVLAPHNPVPAGKQQRPGGKVNSPWPGPMLARSAVRKAAAGQRPALRALDNRTRRPEQSQQFRARPRIRRPRRAERQAGRRAVPEPGQLGLAQQRGRVRHRHVPDHGKLAGDGPAQQRPPRLAPLRVIQLLPRYRLLPGQYAGQQQVTR